MKKDNDKKYKKYKNCKFSLSYFKNMWLYFKIMTNFYINLLNIVKTNQI